MFVRMKHFVFDWGDTIMRDDPFRSDAMHLWPDVELVPGADVVLDHLARTHTLSLATGAVASDEEMICRALKRVGVAQHFGAIFTTKTVGKKKTEVGFWRYVLEALRAKPEEVTVVGDSFETDVACPISMGISAIWLNRRTADRPSSPLYRTIHHLSELVPEVNSLNKCQTRK